MGSEQRLALDQARVLQEHAEHRAYDRGYRDGGWGKLELIVAAKAVVEAVKLHGAQATCDIGAIHKLDAAVDQAESGWVGRAVDQVRRLDETGESEATE